MPKELIDPVTAEVACHPITLGDAIRAMLFHMLGLPFKGHYPGVLGRPIQERAPVVKARRRVATWVLSARTG